MSTANPNGSKVRRGPLISAIVVFVVLVILSQVVFFLIRGEPFEMRIKPAEGGTIVQFAVPSKGLISPEFPVDIQVDGTHQIELRSDDIPIKGCVVESCDTTMLPGMYIIRIGSTQLYLTQYVIKIDGKSSTWQQQKAAQ
jgi:hypothetical protein